MLSKALTRLCSVKCPNTLRELLMKHHQLLNKASSK